MNKLVSLGFVLAGSWYKELYGIDFNLTKFEHEADILYAFVSNDKLKYLGKTTKSFVNRMKGYRKPGLTQFTNIRINGLIFDELRARQDVYIFVLVAADLCKYKEYRVSLAAGLEDIFIRELNPEWNFHGKKKISKQVEEIDEINEFELVKTTPPTYHLISLAPFTKYYLECNFFNVPKKHSIFFGKNGTAIRVEFDSKIIVGRIDRINVPSEAPRIHCGVHYNKWINKNFNIGDRMEVEIISPVSIKLLQHNQIQHS